MTAIGLWSKGSLTNHRALGLKSHCLHRLPRDHSPDRELDAPMLVHGIEWPTIPPPGWIVGHLFGGPGSERPVPFRRHFSNGHQPLES